MTILLVGLLGLAGLIAKGQRASYEAYQRHQALLIASDMVERMKANMRFTPPPAGQPTNIDIANRYAAGAPPGAPLGDPASAAYWSALGGGIPDCAVTTCNREQLADYDLARWEGLLLGALERLAAEDTNIGGIQNARGCIEGPLPAPAPANTYRVSIAWQGDTSTSAPLATTCGQGLYTDRYGNIDDSTRRAVSIDVTLFNPT